MLLLQQAIQGQLPRLFERLGIEQDSDEEDQPSTLELLHNIQAVQQVFIKQINNIPYCSYLIIFNQIPIMKTVTEQFNKDPEAEQLMCVHIFL